MEIISGSFIMKHYWFVYDKGWGQFLFILLKYWEVPNMLLKLLFFCQKKLKFSFKIPFYSKKIVLQNFRYGCGRF